MSESAPNQPVLGGISQPRCGPRPLSHPGGPSTWRRARPASVHHLPAGVGRPPPPLKPKKNPPVVCPRRVRVTAARPTSMRCSRFGAPPETPRFPSPPSPTAMVGQQLETHARRVRAPNAYPGALLFRDVSREGTDGGRRHRQISKPAATWVFASDVRPAFSCTLRYDFHRICWPADRSPRRPLPRAGRPSPTAGRIESARTARRRMGLEDLASDARRAGLEPCL